MTRQRALVFLLSIAFARIILFFLLDPKVFLWEDHDIAVNLLKTGEQFYLLDGSVNHTYQFPVYPFIVFLIYTVFGVHAAPVVVFNLLLNAAASVMMYFFSARLLSILDISEKVKRHAGLISAAVAAVVLLHPGIAYYGMFNIHPFSLDLFFLILCLLMFSWFESDPSARNLVLFAICAGVTILNRASLAVILVPFVLVCFRRLPPVRALQRILITAGICAMISSPWLIRNYLTDGVIGFESSMSRNLWKGSMYGGEGSSFLVTGNNYYKALTEAERKTLGRMTPKGQYVFFLDKYLELLKQDPGQVLQMYVKKMKIFWWFRDMMGNESPAFVKKLVPFYRGYYCFILLFAFVSLFTIRKSYLLFSVPLALSVLQSFFYVETRHRMITEPLLTLLAFIALAAIWSKFIHKGAPHPNIING